MAGRGLEGAYIERVVTYGIPDTSMPAWGKTLPRQELMAVIGYVKSLNGLVVAPESEPATRKESVTLSSDAAQGQQLFFEQFEVLRSCSICHQIGGRGVPVAQPIANVPTDVAGLRDLDTIRIGTAIVGEESFPALQVSKIQDEIKLYDLSGIPPVLRTISTTRVKVTEGSSWRHSSAIRNYSDSDLKSILAYLHAVIVQKQP